MISEFNILKTDSMVIHSNKLFNKLKELKYSFSERQPNIISVISQEEYDRSFLTYSITQKYIIDPEINSLIESAKNIMIQNNFELDDDYALNIEIQYGFSKNNEIITNTFSIHQDDYGAINNNVNTLIIYLDCKCIDGELVFYEYNNNFDKNLPCCLLFNCNESFESFRNVNPNNPSDSLCKAVIFDGSIFHKPNDYSGNRLAIVFQIPRK
jgi:hypothetical protein